MVFRGSFFNYSRVGIALSVAIAAVFPVGSSWARHRLNKTLPNGLPKRLSPVSMKRAVSPPRPTDTVGGRSLVGHLFYKGAANPFFPTNTPTFRTSFQAAMSTVQVPGDAGLRTIGLSPAMMSSFRIGSVGVDLGAQISEVVGSDGSSSTVLGSDMDCGLSAFFRYRLAHGRNWSITPALLFSWNHGFGSSSFSTANQLSLPPGMGLNGSEDAKNNSSVVRPALQANYAVTRIFGFFSEVGYDFGYDSEPTTMPIQAMKLGVSSYANLRSFVGFPLRGNVFAREAIPLKANEGGPAGSVGASVYEMAGEDFNFGGEVSRMMLEPPSTSGVLSLTAYY